MLRCRGLPRTPEESARVWRPGTPPCTSPVPSERGKLSRHNEVAKAFDYMLKRIDVFTRFLDDSRICLSNNAAERELRLSSKTQVYLLCSSPEKGYPDRLGDAITRALAAELGPRRIAGQRYCAGHRRDCQRRWTQGVRPGGNGF